MMRIEGEVVHGDALGRTLGFPTANLHMYDETVPDGVWAARVSLRDGRVASAVVSVGRRPTFCGSDAARLLEAHLIDFEESLYGEWIVVDLIAFIRDQVRFASVRELVAAMDADLARARALTGRSDGWSEPKDRSPVPEWALRRVRSATEADAVAETDERSRQGVGGRSSTVLARQLGMSRRLVRRCLRELDARRETLPLDA